MKKSKKFGIHILGLLVMLFAFVLPVSAGVKEGAGEYEIYPTPQDIVYGTDTMSLTDKVNVTVGDGIDDYTKVKIDVALQELKLEKSTTADEKNTKLIVGVYGSDDAADAFGKANGADAAVFGKYDGYTLWVKGGSIVILGKDTDAAYRGVTTLERIFEQLDGKSIRELTIKDYAEVQFRGFIEGYYGNPWSVEDRIDLMKFGGEIKMNQYVFAPKDDPYHNARWRELYPEDMLQDIGRLAQAGNESKCFFVYALHTFMNNPIDFSSDASYQRDLQIIKDKFSQVMSVGVRQVAILEDDAAGTSAANIIKLLNDLTSWLHEMKDTTYPDLKTDILYCPTCYMDTVNAKMTAINAGVSREVHIVVTGGRIWGEVTSGFADSFYAGLASGGVEGRYPYMWVNWPCNDNTKTSQIMGGHNTILHTGVDGSKYEGIILNPIQESEPSKVAIFTAADFCWQTWDDPAEGDQAWDDAFKYIDHMTPIESEESNALREAAKHMITQAPNQPQTKFDESVELSPMIAQFREKLSAGTLKTADVEGMRAEFQKIHDAANLYLAQGTNKRMIKQMTPFLSCMRDLTQAGINMLDAISSGLSGDSSSVWDQYSEGQAAFEQSKTHGFDYYGIGTIYAQVGRKYLTPFTEEMIKYVSDEVKMIVDPESADNGEKYEAAFSRTSGWAVTAGGNENSMTDGNDNTYVWYNPTTSTQDTSLAGDYIQLDLGESKPVGRVRAVVGYDSADKWTSYHVEYSEDGVKWKRRESYAGASSGKDIYLVNLGGASARYVRLVNDKTINKWVKFCEFSAYAYTGGVPECVSIYTNTENAGWSEEYTDSTYKVLPKENAVLQPGEYVGLSLDRIHAIAGITVTGTGLDQLTLEKSMNQSEWKTKDQAGAARYIRLMNKTGQAVTFSLTDFTVTTEEIQPMDLYETSMNTTMDGDTRYWMDGNLSTKAKYCAPPKKGDYITYDLGQEIDLRSLRVYVYDTAIDYPRDAKIQASSDNVNWTDILTIGDGVENVQADASTKPVESPGGGWTHDTVDVAYAYAENANIDHLKTRYIRLYFTAGYNHRWVELNEILINDGEYIPSVNDPTFETDAVLQRGFEIQNLNDSDLTTAFKPYGTKNGSLIYNLSASTTPGRINILQSGSAISNATVSARTGEDTWVTLGVLDRSFSAFYTQNLENVYAIKIEWKDVIPAIYEIITLQEPGDVLEKNLADVNRDLKAAVKQVEEAVNAVEAISEKVQAAAAKVTAAANASDKLKAEIELQKLYAEKAAAEAVAAEKKAVQAEKASRVAQVEARNLRIKASEAATEEEKNRLEQEAADKETEASRQDQEVKKQQQLATDKKAEEEKYIQAAADKQTELDNLQNQGNQEKPDPKPDNPQPVQPDPAKPVVTEFNYKNVKYKVVSASAKTVAAAGVTTKKVKSVTIYDSIKYGGQTWKVIEIKDKAFKGCSKLAKVTIGKNVKKIGKEAFAQCGKLKNVNMKKAANITSIGKKAFSKIDAKAKIVVPAKKLAKYKKMLKKAGVPKKATIKK